MGSIDIPPFLRDKMKKDIQDNSNEIDIPDFLKKKDGSDLSGKRPSSYPLANGLNATQSPSNGQSKSSAFDPATFMRQSRANIPADDFSTQNPIDLAKQSDELSKERVETPQDVNNPNAGGNYVSNTQSVEKSKKINDYLTKSGFDADKLNKLFSDFPDEYYTALGTTKDQMAKDLKDNPVKTEQQIASAKWQIPVQQNILNTQGQQGLIDFQNTRNVFADKGTDYATKRRLAPQLLQTIRLNTPASEMGKIQANFANDAAQAYGDVQDTDPTLLAEQKQYPNLNTNQVRAMDYLKDVSPDKAQGFAAALVDPKKLKDNYDAQVGQEEKLKRLDEIGISLKENSLNEQFAPVKKVYDQLYNLKQNGTITPEQDAQLQQAESIGAPLYQQLQNLKSQSNDLLVKYPKAGVNDAGLFAQELLGQKHTGLNWLALQSGQATSGAANSVWDLVSEPFRSDENSKIHQLSTLGDSKISQGETNLTQANQLDQTSKPTVSKDLQSYVDQLKGDKTLTDEQKSDLLTKRLMQNPDQWQRTPIEGGKTNIGITSMLYGTGQLAATLAPYVLAETATGGGASAGFARKFTSSFASMLGTSFHDAYSQAIDNGEADPYGYALRTTAINSAAMAGAGTPEAIKYMLKGKSAVGDLVGKMTDDEILGALRSEPKEMSLFRKSAGIVKNAGKAVAESGVEGIKSAAKISPFITGGQMLNDIIDDNAKSPQDYAKQAAIEGLKFAVMGTALGTVGKIGATDVNKAAMYEAGANPESFLEALKQKEDNGSITPEDAAQVRNNITNAQQVFKKVPFVDAKGKPLGERARRDLLFLKMQENDITDNISKDLPQSLQDKMQDRLVDTQAKIDKIYKGTLLEEAPKKQSNKLTPEAVYYLKSVDEGKLPKTMTDNLATIASDNGIPTPEGTTVNHVIKALKIKAAKGRVEDFERSVNPEYTPDLLQKLKSDPNAALNELINHHLGQMKGANQTTKDFSQNAVDKFKQLRDDYNLINTPENQPEVNSVKEEPAGNAEKFPVKSEESSFSPEENKHPAKLKEVLDNHEKSENSTFNDLVNSVEAYNEENQNDNISKAVDDYRDAQQTDYKLKGRGDMDSAETEFQKVLDQEIKNESDNSTNNEEKPADKQPESVAGKEIEPHKEVSASKSLAQKEVAVKYDLKPMEASMLHSLKDKDVNQEYEDAEGLKKAMYDKLYEKGFIGFNEDGTSYELSEKGNDFIKAVDARHDTRKNVKAGTDLFPEDANIPELQSIKKELKNSIDDNTIEQFEQRPADEVEKSEPTISDIESKASSDNEADLTEAIRQADELIGNSPAEDQSEPDKGKPEVATEGKLNKDEIGKVAFARSNSYNVFKVIHPEMTVDDYNKLRSSNIEIPNSELRKLGREYLESHPENEAANTEKFYDEIAGSKPTNTGRIPVSPIIGKPKHLSEILLDVSKSLKQKIFFLKPGRGAAGTYSPGSAAIKIKFTGDLDVTAHEIGHSIDDNFKVLAELRDNPDPAIELELSKFSPFGSKPPKDYPDPELYKRAEGFAEWLRAFIVNPDEAIKQAPKIYELYNSKVSDAYKKALENFSNDVRTWAGSTGRDMVLSNIQWEPEKAKGLIKEIFSRPDNDMFSISWVDKLAANWVNPMRAFEKAFEYAKGIKGIDEVLPDKDPTILARLFLSVDRKFGDFLEHGLRNAKDELLKTSDGKAKTFKWLIEPLDNTDMATIKKEMEDVTSFMVAERTVELANKFSRASILTGIGGGIYKDVDVAIKALEEFQEGDPAKLKRIKEAAKRYREFSNDVMGYMVDKGRLSKEAFDQIRLNNVQYVALHRIMEAEPGTEVQVFTGETRKLSSVNQPVQDIKGSTRKIMNPYTSLLDSMHKTIKESDRNEVLQAFREMIVSQRGLYEGSTKKLSEVGVVAKVGDKNTIIVFVDGKPEKWVLQEDVYKALKGLDNDGFKLPGILTFHAKILRNMTTKFPTFAVRNWIRDLQDRLIKSNDHSGVRDLFGDKEHWKDVARKGGLNSGYYVRDKAHYYGLMEQAMDEIAKNQKTIFADPIKIKKLWHGYENILESAETSNRVAEYRAAFKQAKLKGMDDYNAGLYGAFKSRDLMDFAVAGHYMKTINKMIPFSNAAVQGVRSSVVRAIENPAGFLIRTALYSVFPQVALWWWNHKDEDTAKEYENLPLYQRDMFYNTKIGANKWLSIPKPYELGMLAAGVDRGLSLAYGYNNNAYSGYAGNIFKAISPVDPSIMGGPMQPLIESMTNYDFFRDKNIITPNENVLNLALRHTETASWLSQQIQKAAGIDARKIDHIIRSQFSYVGNEGLKAIDKSVGLVGGKEPAQRNDFDITDLGLFKRSPAYNSPAVQNMMEFAKEWKLDRSKDYKEFKNIVAKYFDATTDEEKDDYAKQMIDLSNLLMTNWKRAGVEDRAKAKFEQKFK